MFTETFKNLCQMEHFKSKKYYNKVNNTTSKASDNKRTKKHLSKAEDSEEKINCCDNTIIRDNYLAVIEQSYVKRGVKM